MLVKAAFLASAAPPPVLTEVAAAAFLAGVALPPVLADAAAAALLAVTAHPPVFADAARAALFAGVALPPVRTGHPIGHGAFFPARLAARVGAQLFTTRPYVSCTAMLMPNGRPNI